MTKTFKTIENNAEIIYEMPDDAPRLNTDGFGPALVGFPLTTVSLFQQQFSQDPTKQERKVIATIQFPTASILELAQNISTTLRDNRAAVESSLENIKTVIAKSV